MTGSEESCFLNPSREIVSSSPLFKTVLMYSTFLSEGILSSSAKTFRVFKCSGLLFVLLKAASIGVCESGFAVKFGSTLQMLHYQPWPWPCWYILEIPIFKYDADKVLMVSPVGELLEQSPSNMVPLTSIVLLHSCLAHLNIKGRNNTKKIASPIPVPKCWAVKKTSPYPRPHPIVRAMQAWGHPEDLLQ